jgi:polysaccharide biosynthesis protein PslG
VENVHGGMRKLALCLTLLALLTLPATADAAARTIPQGFYGVGYSGNVELLSAPAQGKLWDRLATGGAESVRLLFNWDLTEGTKGHYKWGRIDSLVINATRRGMKILPVVEYAPNWAKKFPGRSASPPRGTADYTAFLRQLILRYGPGTVLAKATFWKAHPELLYRPIQQWEIWNEPEITYHWLRQPFNRPWSAADAREYVALLRDSFTTVHTADPQAKVVLAALSIDSWKNLKKLYDWTDIEGMFDIAAIQAYSGTTGFIPTLMRNFRGVLNAHGASGTPLYVTEMTWPAAKGKSNPSYTTGYMSGFITDQKGAAARLTQAYKTLRNMRNELKLLGVYWYTGVTAYAGKNEFEYSGLLSYQKGAVKQFPVYTAYQKSAAAVQGCSKKANGTCR